MSDVNPRSRAVGLPIAGLLGRAFRRIEEHFPEDEWSGLRQSHFRVLWHVPPEGGTITGIAEAVGMTQQGCGQFISALESDGYLTVAQDPADRRVRRVRRTAHGDAMVESFLVAYEELEDQWRALVGPRRYATFRAVLDRLAE